MNDDPIGVVQIGVGGYGRSHLESIRQCVERGICSLNAVTIRPEDTEPDFEAELSSQGVKIYRDVGEMFKAEAGRSSVVANPTGIPSHRTLTEAAISDGYHVVCEKPVAGSMADARAMRDARDAGDRILAIGYQYIHSETVQMIKRARVAGEWGALRSAKCLALWPRTTTYYARNNWAGEIDVSGLKVYDSPAQNAVSHFLNNLLYLSGDAPNEGAGFVTLYGENYRAKPIGSADTQYINGTTSTGVEISFWCSHSVSVQHEIEMVLTFENAEIRFRRGGPENRCDIVTSDGVQPFGVDEADGLLRMRVFEDAFDAVRTGRQPLCSIDNAIWHTEAIETLFTRCAPIATIDDAFIDVEQESSHGEGPSGINHVIRGLDNLAAEAYRLEKSYSDMGAKWAVPGKRVSLE